MRFLVGALIVGFVLMLGIGGCGGGGGFNGTGTGTSTGTTTTGGSTGGSTTGSTTGGTGGSGSATLSQADWYSNGWLYDRYIFSATQDGWVRVDMTAHFPTYLFAFYGAGGLIIKGSSWVEWYAYTNYYYEIQATSYYSQTMGNYDIFWSNGLAYQGQIFPPGAPHGAQTGGILDKPWNQTSVNRLLLPPGNVRAIPR